MKLSTKAPGPARGFSLIEVLIAVVVLSTGLLALAALQGSLTKASAEAKVRSQVAVLLSARMDQLRTSGYPSVVDGVTDSCAANASDGTSWVPTGFCAQNGLSTLSTAQDVSTYISNGAGSFVIGTPGSPDETQFKRVIVDATWSDAAGISHKLAMESDISPLALTDSLVPPLDTTAVNVGGPVVRQASPLSDGMIPIALGNGTDTAATNPKPTLGSEGANQTLPSTSYTVLSYQNDAYGSVIQRRIETRVVECTCKGGDTSLLASIDKLAAFRPTYWNANGFARSAKRQVAPTSGPYINPSQDPKKAGVKQDALCTICCRDHSDSATNLVKADGTTDAVLFDPYTSDFNRYLASVAITGNGQNATVKVSLTGVAADGTGTPIVAGASDVYLDACRVILRDGVWTVTQDLRSEHMGLLATAPLGQATTQSLDSTASAGYEQFSVEYLGKKAVAAIGKGVAPDAVSLYDSHGLNAPTSIPVTVNGKRYLHARGLYLEHLEQPALDKLTSIYDSCDPSDRPGCLLPYLSFNASNVSELANWTTTNTSKLTVTNGSGGAIGDPLRGVVTGKGTGSPDPSAVVTMGMANSAYVSSLALSPYELNAANVRSDTQPFVVSGASVVNTLNLRLGALNQTSDLSTNNDPRLSLTVAGIDNDCLASLSRSDTDPNDYQCVATAALTLPMGINIQRYNLIEERTETDPCDASAGTVQRQYLVCNKVSSVTGLPPLATATTTETGGKTQSAVSTIALNGAGITLTSASTVSILFESDGEKAADFTCDAITNQPIFTTPTTCP